MKCDGSRINITNKTYLIPVESANEYVREDNKLIFGLKDQIKCPDLSRSHRGTLKLFESIDVDPSDFEIRATGGSLKVTKNILIIKWNYFKTMINSNCVEKLNDVWIVEDFSLKTMADIVGYVYCDAITFEDAAQAMELAKAAHRYLLDDLLLDCSTYLGAQLIIDNVLPMLLLSDMYNLPNLKRKCLKLIPGALKKHKMKDIPGYGEFSNYASRAELLETCLEEIYEI
ncbi:hypothetical protein HDE_08817 [Halotydeus destructor]|nr:hypothetical protein HDE_08817 [Halotydeus destructor]